MGGALLGGAELGVEQLEPLEREGPDHALAGAEEMGRRRMREPGTAGDLPEADVAHALFARELLHRLEQRGAAGRAWRHGTLGNRVGHQVLPSSPTLLDIVKSSGVASSRS
jgi:hypothetical protein